MKLIHLEDVKEFLKSRRYTEKKGDGHVLALSPTVIDELDTLKTIDPIATIDSFYKEVESSENSEMLLELKKRFYGFL